MSCTPNSDIGDFSASLSNAEVDVLQQRLAANAVQYGEAEPTAHERRRDSRRPYPYRQLIAPVIDGNLPSGNDFGYVRCSDIASGGFAFVAATPPGTNLFVVALGHPPQLTYLMAEVMHVSRVADDKERRYLVGCKYVGRAAY